jgi:hypothetical protein
MHVFVIKIKYGSEIAIKVARLLVMAGVVIGKTSVGGRILLIHIPKLDLGVRRREIIIIISSSSSSCLPFFNPSGLLRYCDCFRMVFPKIFVLLVGYGEFGMGFLSGIFKEHVFFSNCICNCL